MNRSRPFSKRGAYIESDNAPARNRVWPRETSQYQMVVAEGGATYIGCALQKIDIYTLIEQSSNYRITCMQL